MGHQSASILPVTAGYTRPLAGLRPYAAELQVRNTLLWYLTDKRILMGPPMGHPMALDIDEGDRSNDVGEVRTYAGSISLSPNHFLHLRGSATPPEESIKG